MIKNKIIALIVALIAFGSHFLIFNSPKTVTKTNAESQIKVGIDISYHQGEVNWEQIKSSGVSFVMLRIGYDYTMDLKFESYLEGAKSVGLDIGVYFYSYADSVADAINEGLNCVKWLNNYPTTFTYPIVYDVEETKIAPFSALATKAFCEVLLNNGYYPMVYANTNWFNSVIEPLFEVSHLEFWQANYFSSYAGKTPLELLHLHSNRPKLKEFDQNVKMWQCTDSGKVSGIKGGVDVNICYEDFAKIIKSEGYNGFEKEDKNNLTAICKSKKVNIRAKPTTNSEILGYALINDTFAIKRRYNSNWLEIEYLNGLAYVYSSYFTVEEKSHSQNGSDKNENSESIGNSGENLPSQNETGENSEENLLKGEGGCKCFVYEGLFAPLLLLACFIIAKTKK